ncbi:MAG: hypothetical protein CEE43_03600 [Promethearchaeota archaeon Loki_b32]|nr:MAG: hypothetical protein CEE43_03600 [Candidatus Lokiarchaeota archaeon Loki_b32]
MVNIYEKSAYNHGEKNKSKKKGFNLLKEKVPALKFLPHLPRDQWPAQTLSAAIYEDSAVRTMEREAVSKGRDKDTGENIFPPLELVRFTIPRRVYTNTHMEYIAESIVRLYEKRDTIPGLKMVFEPKHLRFFQARFEQLAF